MLSSTSSKFNLGRRKTATILSIVGCAFSVLLTTGISSYLVGIIDSFVNQFGILLLIGVQCVIFAWFYNLDNLIAVLNENGHLKVGKTWEFIIKYLLPIALFGQEKMNLSFILLLYFLFFFYSCTVFYFSFSFYFFIFL